MPILFVDVEAVNEWDWNAIGVAVFDDEGNTLDAKEWCRPLPRESYDELRVAFWSTHVDAERYIEQNQSTAEEIARMGDTIQEMILRHGVTALATDCPSFDVSTISRQIGGSPFLPVICVRTYVNTVKELVNRGKLKNSRPTVIPAISKINHTPLADVAKVASSYFWARSVMRG
jgi:hypothetical protein